MLSIVKTLAVRFVTLVGVLVVVLLLLVVSLGATGFSDDLLNAQVNQELLVYRIAQANAIKDPQALQFAVEQKQKELEQFYGLDQAWYRRMLPQLGRLLRLDLGNARSLRTAEGSSKVSDIVTERLPYTLMLLLTTSIITAVIGITVGVRMATRVGSRSDRSVAYFSAISSAVPGWWLGILFILVFAFKLQWLPAGGMYSTPPPETQPERFFDLAKHAILPITTLVLVSIGPYIYGVRTLTVSVAQEDHVLLARAKGLPDKLVMRRHILRVAAPPIVTGLVLGLAGTISGAILIETVFNWRGMGRLYYDSIQGTPDEGVVVALTFLFTLIYVVARFILDILYVFLDPRVRI